jgi:hypothetical protein
MNRRDYLKRMGLATAVTLGSNHLAGLRAFAGAISAPLANMVEWPKGTTRPEPAKFDVKLIFAGMCIFGYDGTEGHVAFHRGHPRRHKMQVIVTKRTGTKCTDISLIPQSIHTMEVGINDKSSDAKFFLGDYFDRPRDKGDELDFRWLLDLEGPEFYKMELKPKNNHKFSTKLVVKHGTFYTYQRTNTTFKAIGGPSPGYLGHIAKVMAANIELQDGESAYLRINRKRYPLPKGAQYEIYFLNERVSGPVNDFGMAFDELDNSSLKFSIDSVKTGDDTSTTDLCHNLPLVKRATDEAPCMGAGFSSGKGLG